MAITIDEYRFLIGGERFYPASDLTFTWDKFQDEIFFRKGISKLKFINSASEALDDFTALWNLENSPNKCAKIPLQVDIFCNDVWVEFFKGSIHLIDGDWNLSSCQVDIDVRPSDKYSCILDNWENPVNVFEFVAEEDRVQLDTVIGTLEFAACFNEVELEFGQTINWEDPEKGCVEGTAGWQVYNFSNVFIEKFVNLQWKPYLQKHSYWVRERWDGGGVPIGSDWVEENGTYYREVTLFLTKKLEPYVNSGGIINVGAAYSEHHEVMAAVFDNGIKWKDFIEILVKQTCDSVDVESFFYEINAVNDTINDAYQYAADYFKELVVYQKSDIKSNNKGQNATSFTGSDNPLTLKKVLDDLKKFQNVYWDITDDGKFQLEHKSRFLQNGDWDLTEDPYDEMIDGDYSYTYKKDKLPRSEEWQYMDEVSNDFIGKPITYNNACVTNQDQLTDKKFKCGYFTNDIPYMLANPDDVSNDGLVLVAADEDFKIIREDYIQDANIFQYNGCMSFFNLIPALMLWDRPQITGRVNSIFMTFYSQIAQRSCKPIRIHLCCQSLLDLTTLNKYTRLGWCRVSKISLQEPSAIVTLELEF